MADAVLKALRRLFASRKGSVTAEYEKQLASSTEKRYLNRKQLVHVLRHWRQDDEFVRQVSTQTY